MVVCLCILIVFWFRRESLKLILVDEPPPWGGSVIVGIRAILRQHTTYQKITTTLCRWGSLSPYNNYSSLLSWQTNIFVDIHLQNCINEGMSWFFKVFNLFCCWRRYFVVCGFYRTVRACGCLLFLFMRFFGCLCLAIGHWVKCLWWGWSETPMMGMMWNVPDRDDWSLFYRYTNMR
jgi:hypothetical protein